MHLLKSVLRYAHTSLIATNKDSYSWIESYQNVTPQEEKNITVTLQMFLQPAPLFENSFARWARVPCLPDSIKQFRLSQLQPGCGSTPSCYKVCSRICSDKIITDVTTNTNKFFMLSLVFIGDSLFSLFFIDILYAQSISYWFPDDNGEAKQTVEGGYPITREATI